MGEVLDLRFHLLVHRLQRAPPISGMWQQRQQRNLVVISCLYLYLASLNPPKRAWHRKKHYERFGNDQAGKGIAQFTSGISGMGAVRGTVLP